MEAVAITVLHQLNLSSNLLSSQIPPPSPNSSFSSNPVLCTHPLPPAPLCSDTTRPGSSSIPSSPVSARTTNVTTHHGSTAKMGAVAITALVVGDVLVFILVLSVLYCCLWRIFVGKNLLRRGLGLGLGLDCWSGGGLREREDGGSGVDTGQERWRRRRYGSEGSEGGAVDLGWKGRSHGSTRGGS